MVIESLSFVRDAQTPTAHQAGIVIAVSPGPDARRVLLRGACKIAREDALLQGVDLPRAIFVTAIDAIEQRPFTQPLVDQRLVFPENVTLLGDDYLIEFLALLNAERSMVGPYFLHASFFEHASNVVYVQYARVEPR
jgi:hypothetical protein